MTQTQVVIRDLTAIADPNNSTNAIPNTLKVNADGSINVEASGATFSAGAVATAAAPSYTEGTTDPLSQTLAGNLRVVAVGAGTAGTANTGVQTVQGIAGMTPILATITPVASTTMTATQVTVPATANGILILASNANRKGATISNPSSVTVYIQQGSTGVTTSNGFGIPAGSSYNIDVPLYTGAIYGIIATGTQVVTVVELT
jgi:hypothetical protein